MISGKIVGLPAQRTTKEFYKKHADDIEELTTIAGPPASDEEDISEDDSDDEHVEETSVTGEETGGNVPVNSPNTTNDEDDDADYFFPPTPTSSTKHIILTPSRNPVVNISRLSHSVVKSRLSISDKHPESSSLYATPPSSIQRTRLSDTVFLTPSTASEFSPFTKAGLFKAVEDSTSRQPVPCSISNPVCPVSSSDSFDSPPPTPCCPSCSISLDKSSLMLCSRALELGDLECDLQICDLCLDKQVKSCTDGNCSKCVDSKSIVNIRKALRASLPVGDGEKDNDEKVWANTTNLLESQEL